MRVGVTARDRDRDRDRVRVRVLTLPLTLRLTEGRVGAALLGRAVAAQRAGDRLRVGLCLGVSGGCAARPRGISSLRLAGDTGEL